MPGPPEHRPPSAKRLIGIALAVVSPVGLGTRLALIRATFTVVEPCGGGNFEIIVTAKSGFGPVTFSWESKTSLTRTVNPPDSPKQTDVPRGHYMVHMVNDVGIQRDLNIELGGREDVALATTTPSGFLSADGAIKP